MKTKHTTHSEQELRDKIYKLVISYTFTEMIEPIIDEIIQIIQSEREKALSRLYIDIYRLPGETINKQAGFIHKHIILDKIDRLKEQLAQKEESK